jgi:hypothetical protein
LAQGNNSCRSGFSGRSSFPVIQALLSFQFLSFQCLPFVLAIRRALRSLQIKEIKKGEAQRTICRALPFVKEIAYKAAVSGDRNI